MNALRKRPLLFLVILLIADVFLLADVAGTIRWSQLNPLFRHGTDSKGQSSDGTGASNNLPKFDANGGLTDSGVAYNSVGGFYQTLGIGGASQTQRGRLNLIQGTGCTIGNSDNSGTNSSDVTITCSGGGSGTGNSISYGACGSLPTSGQTAGNLYKCTDFPLEYIFTSASAAQGYFMGMPITPPPRRAPRLAG